MKTNYHTHTTFCDGKSSVEEMIQDAISSGFDILGFSSHAASPYSSSWHLKPVQYDEYCASVRDLGKKYESNIKILLGFEADYFPLVCKPDKSRYEKFSPDFLIGSVHYVINLDAEFSDIEYRGYPQEDCDIPYQCFAIDGSEEEVKFGLENMFLGDGKKACQTYFQLERQMIEECDFDIIGHPDIVRKRNAALKFFCEDDEWYKRELKETASIISKSNKIVEVNYGGIARGTLNDTYPSLDFMRILKEKNVPLTISADAHNVGQLNCGYDFAVEQMKKAGYKEFFYLEDGHWISESI